MNKFIKYLLKKFNIKFYNLTININGKIIISGKEIDLNNVNINLDGGVEIENKN